MLRVDVLRGDDATGVAVVNKYQGVTVLKEAWAVDTFLRAKEWDEEEKTLLSSGKALLGHNRKATVGKKVDENAHPFVYDNRWVFFHNGTLHNHKSIKDTDVDSEALGYLLTACEGDKAKLEEALEKVWGAYACVWYDADKHKVYFLRNAERPLFYSKTDDGHLLYASEAWMIAAGASRNNIKVDKYISVPVNTLIEIDCSDNSLPIKETPLEKKALPLVTRGHATSTPTTTVTKGQAKKLQVELSKCTHMSFFLEDATPNTVASNVSETEVYDWLLEGINDNWEGVVFRAVVKDYFPMEIEPLYSGVMISGTIDYIYYDHSQKMVICRLKAPKWAKQSITC